MRRPIHSALAALALAASIAHALPALAQSSTAIAEQMFLDGQKLMDAKKYPEACAKFADSQRLDPAAGTLMHLAACHEKMGKNATAWSEFVDLAALSHKANNADRERFAKEHAAALEGKLQKVILEMGRPPEGVAIRLDGIALPASVLGTEIPLDPGNHVLEITAPGKKPWRQDKLDLGPSAAVTRIQVTLEDDVAGAPAPAPASAPAPGPAAAPPPAAEPSSGDATKRLLGFALGGAGIVSIGVGIAEEVTSIGRHNDESKYPSGSPQQAEVSDQSSKAQTYAIVFGAAGLVAVGAGVYLVLTSSSAPASTTGRLVVSPVLAPGVAGAGLHLDW